MNGEKVKEGKITKEKVPGGGFFLLGQDQDSVGGGFQSHQRFIGTISQFQMWDRMLSEEEVRNLYNGSSNIIGNIFDDPATYKAEPVDGALIKDKTNCFPNPCRNGASCVDEINSYSCTCLSGYEGNNCQTNINECASNPCKNGASCVDGVNSYSCTCSSGYEGDNCQTNINDCASKPCKNGATCVDGVNSYSCTCLSGYEGVNCQKGSSNGDIRLTGTQVSEGRGRLEVYYNGQWGAVCDHKTNFNSINNNKAAQVACYQLGYGRKGVRTEPQDVGSTNLVNVPFLLGDVSCNGNEMRIEDCQKIMNPDCETHEGTGVDCGSASGYPESIPKWRDDLRCGPDYDNAGCNPDSKYPCCSPQGWCGNTEDHCHCSGCKNWSKR